MWASLGERLSIRMKSWCFWEMATLCREQQTNVSRSLSAESRVGGFGTNYRLMLEIQE